MLWVSRSYNAAPFKVLFQGFAKNLEGGSFTLLQSGFKKGMQCKACSLFRWMREKRVEAIGKADQIHGKGK
jgi:hypothetical protein